MNILDDKKENSRKAENTYADFLVRKKNESKTPEAIKIENEVRNISFDKFDSVQSIIQNLPAAISILNPFKLSEEVKFFRTYERGFGLKKLTTPPEEFLRDHGFDRLFQKSAYFSLMRSAPVLPDPSSIDNELNQAREHFHDFLISSKGFCYMNFSPLIAPALYRLLKDSEIKSISELFSYLENIDINYLSRTDGFNDKKTINLLNNVITDCFLDSVEASNLAASITSFYVSGNHLARWYNSIENAPSIINFNKEIFDKALSHVITDTDLVNMIRSMNQSDRRATRSDGGLTSYKPQNLINKFLDNGYPETAQTIVEIFCKESWLEDHKIENVLFNPKGLHLPKKETFESYFTKTPGAIAFYAKQKNDDIKIFEQMSERAKDIDPSAASFYLSLRKDELHETFFENSFRKATSSLRMLRNPEVYAILLQQFPVLIDVFAKQYPNIERYIAENNWTEKFSRTLLELGAGYDEYQEIMKKL